MGCLIYAIIIIGFLLHLSTPIISRKAMFEVIYVNISPYITVDKFGNASGIISDIFEFAELFCHEEFKSKLVYDRVFDYTTEIRSMTHINDLLNSNETYGHGELANITEEYAFWFPIYETIDYYAYKNIKKRKLTLFHVNYLEEMVVITSEKRIHLIEKVWIGLTHCTSVAILACVGGICFALLIWFIERYAKSDFSPYFIKGFGTGAWLTVVTMGTVGYGDVTPKTCPGRVVAFFWMIVSVVFASVMTATISDVVHGVSSLELYDKKVTGFAHSPEETIAKHDYHAKFYGAETIEDMVNLLENHTVEYGLLNAEVAAYYQDDFYYANKGDESLEQLVFIYSIKVKVPIEFLVNMNTPSVSDYIKCFKLHEEEIVPSVLAKYKKHLKFETLHHISMTKLFKQYPLLSYFSASMIGIIILGIAYEFHAWFTQSKRFQAI